MRREYEESRQQEQEWRPRWITYHRERRPVYPPSGERGAFAGVFGFRTIGGTQEFPYYQTPSGVYFYEASTPRFLGDTEPMQRKTKRIDADRWRREGVRMSTAELSLVEIFARFTMHGLPADLPVQYSTITRTMTGEHRRQARRDNNELVLKEMERHRQRMATLGFPFREGD